MECHQNSRNTTNYIPCRTGREIISNLAKAAGLATMIATMRPDIDNLDEYVRNTTARAFAVVASALGIPALLPFLKAVCQSRKSWQARHTGIKIVMQVRVCSSYIYRTFIKKNVFDSTLGRPFELLLAGVSGRLVSNCVSRGFSTLRGI